MAKIKTKDLNLYNTKDVEKLLGKKLHISQPKAKELLYGYIDTIRELLEDETMDGIHIQGFEEYLVLEKPSFLTCNPKDKTPMMTKDGWKIKSRLSKYFTRKILDK
jgi:nucleoid DNA-binding protein